MYTGKGFGKVILFGEHFVVYGLPGIASGISASTSAFVEEGEKGFELIDNRPAAAGYKEKKKEEMKRQIDALLRHFNIEPEKTPLKITLGGNLFCDSGIGASAALATSISRAFSQELGLKMNDEQINHAAFIAEEAGSGTPSGIDNTCSVFGGFITFEKNKSGGPNKIENISIKRPVEIIMASTGIAQETKLVVEDVKRKKEKDAKWFDGLCRKYKLVFDRALEGIKVSDWKTVGMLMDENQALLREMDVSCDELERLIKTAKDSGALGAKLTGTGRGGYMVALTPTKKLQEKVAKSIEAAGFNVLRTAVG